MAREIKEIVHIANDGPHVDPFIFQKWLEQGNTELLRRLVTVEKFIRHIHAMTGAQLQRGASSSQREVVVDLFFETMTKLKQALSKPNEWQRPLLHLLRQCNYRDDEIVRGIREQYKTWPADVREHMDSAASELGLSSIFGTSKK